MSKRRAEEQEEETLDKKKYMLDQQPVTVIKGEREAEAVAMEQEKDVAVAVAIMAEKDRMEGEEKAMEGEEKAMEGEEEEEEEMRGGKIPENIVAAINKSNDLKAIYNSSCARPTAPGVTKPVDFTVLLLGDHCSGKTRFATSIIGSERKPYTSNYGAVTYMFKPNSLISIKMIEIGVSPCSMSLCATSGAKCAIMFSPDGDNYNTEALYQMLEQHNDLTRYLGTDFVSVFNGVSRKQLDNLDVKGRNYRSNIICLNNKVFDQKPLLYLVRQLYHFNVTDLYFKCPVMLEAEKKEAEQLARQLKEQAKQREEQAQKECFMKIIILFNSFGLPAPEDYPLKLLYKAESIGDVTAILRLLNLNLDEEERKKLTCRICCLVDIIDTEEDIEEEFAEEEPDEESAEAGTA